MGSTGRLPYFYVLLEDDTTYWLAIAPEVPFAGFYQTGWVKSSDNTDTLAKQGFPDVSPPVAFWTTTGNDMAFVLGGFRMLPQCGNGVIDPGEECDPGTPELGIPPDPGSCPGPCIAPGEPDECTCGHCPYIPADIAQSPCPECPVDCSTYGACEDGRIEVGEMASYLCAWKNGCNNDTPGTAWAVNVWVTGECYCWDNVHYTWTSEIPCPAPDSGCCGDPGREKAVPTRALAAPPIAPLGSAAARIIPSERGSDDDGQELHVAITIDADKGASAVALEYEIPGGWKVATISDDGAWDAHRRKIKWGPFVENLSRTVTATLTAVGQPGKVIREGFSGTVSFDGVNHPIAVE